MSRIRAPLLNAALGPLDYRLPEGLEAPPGSTVKVPLGPREVTGMVWDPGRLAADEVMPRNCARSAGSTIRRRSKRGCAG